MFELAIELSDVTHHFTTTDFLQVCCDVSEKLGSNVTGQMVTELLTEKVRELEFLRVIDWNFEYRANEATVRLRKVV